MRGAIGTSWIGGEYGMQRRLKVLTKTVGFRGKIVCDIGCGVGRYCLEIAKSKAKCVIGIDLDAKHIKRARTFTNGYSNVCLVVASAETLPIRNKIADITLLIEVIEHVDCQNKCVSQVYRTLKPRGIAFITAPNRFFPIEMHGLKVSGGLVRNILGIGVPLLSWAPKWIHCKVENAKIYSQKDLVLLLQRNGFRILLIDYMMPPLDRLRISEIMKDAIRKLFSFAEKIPLLRQSSAHVIVVVQKL